jgi:hypothetical protein
MLAATRRGESIVGIVAVFAVGLVLACWPATSAARARQTASSPRVVVVKRWLRIDQPNQDAAYGLILRNRSRQDALLIKISVAGLDSQGGSFTSDHQQLTVIPSGAEFVVDGQLIWGTSIQLSRIRVHIHVGRFEAKGRRLPRVLHASVVPTPVGGIGLDAKVTIRNPYKRSLGPWAKVYIAYFDAQGNIYDVGDATTGATISRGETVSIDLPGDLSEVPPYLDSSGVHSVLATVDPCGIDAGSRQCPIAGAR